MSSGTSRPETARWSAADSLPADAVSAAARLTAAARWLRRNGLDGTIDQLRVAAYIALLSGRPLADLVPAAPTAPSRQTAAGDRTEDSAGPDAADNATCRDTPAGDELPAGYTSGRLQPPLTGTINLTMPVRLVRPDRGAPGELAGHGRQGELPPPARDLDSAQRAGTARWCLTLTTDDGQVIAHACAAAPPPPGAAAISWARGLRDKLEFLQVWTLRSPPAIIPIPAATEPRPPDPGPPAHVLVPRLPPSGPPD